MGATLVVCYLVHRDWAPEEEALVRTLGEQPQWGLGRWPVGPLAGGAWQGEERVERRTEGRCRVARSQPEARVWVGGWGLGAACSAAPGSPRWALGVHSGPGTCPRAVFGGSLCFLPLISRQRQSRQMCAQWVGARVTTAL